MVAKELRVPGFENKFLIRSATKASNAPMKITWYSKKWFIVLLHSLFWIAIFALPFLVRTSNNDPRKPPFEIGYLYFYIVTRPFWVGLFYLNAFYFFPKLVPPKKYALYV